MVRALVLDESKGTSEGTESEALVAYFPPNAPLRSRLAVLGFARACEKFPPPSSSVPGSPPPHPPSAPLA